jgi:hypothetical protein
VDPIDANPPDTVVVLKPDHVRDVDLFVRRYDARAFGACRPTRSRPARTGGSARVGAECG